MTDSFFTNDSELGRISMAERIKLHWQDMLVCDAQEQLNMASLWEDLHDAYNTHVKTGTEPLREYFATDEREEPLTMADPSIIEVISSRLTAEQMLRLALEKKVQAWDSLSAGSEFSAPEAWFDQLYSVFDFGIRESHQSWPLFTNSGRNMEEPWCEIKALDVEPDGKEVLTVEGSRWGCQPTMLTCTLERPNKDSKEVSLGFV